MVQRQVALQQPTLFVVEVCATVARRTGDATLAAAVGDALLSAPRLALHPLDPERSTDEAFGRRHVTDTASTRSTSRGREIAFDVKAHR